MKFIETRNCPCCNANPSDSVREISAKIQAENLSELELRDYFIGFRKEQCFFSYNRCNQCGLLYCPVYFTEEALNDMYASMPQNTSVSGERDSQKTQFGYAKLINSTKGGKFLEIGADLALLSKRLLETNKVNSVDAVEPNLEVEKSLLKNIRNSGQIYTDLNSIPLTANYDAAGAIHVIDHLLDPRETLSQISNHLKPESTLLIVVHNEKSFLRHILRRSWPPFCLQHPQLFSPRTLEKTLLISGFQVSKNRRTVNYVSMKQIIMLLKSIGIVSKKFPNFLPDVAIPVIFGNIAVLSSKS